MPKVALVSVSSSSLHSGTFWKSSDTMLQMARAARSVGRSPAFDAPVKSWQHGPNEMGGIQRVIRNKKVLHE
jgi:hypothetical protein